LDRHYAGGLTLTSPSLATTDSHGVYEIDSLPTGAVYTLRASDPRHGCVRLPGSVTLTPGEVRLLAPVALPVADSFIAGRVVDLQGFPVAGAQVAATGATTGTRSAVSDERGRFRIARVANEPLRVEATIIPPRVAFTKPLSVPHTGRALDYVFGAEEYFGGQGGSAPTKTEISQEEHGVTAAAGNSNVTVRIKPD
jgi:hypothetical protein